MFDSLITEILKREGWPKYSNDPADHGGPTKGGITLKDIEDCRHKKCTAEDVQNLEESEARSIYLYKYVLKHKFDQIYDSWVQEFVVDTGVLQGQQEAAKMLQSVLNVPQDGILGPVTFASLSIAMRKPIVLKDSLIRARMHLLLDDMVAEIPVEIRQSTNLKWRHGWWNRVADFL